MLKKHSRKFILLLLFALSLIPISTVGSAISYALFYAVVTIPLISCIYLLYVYKSFSIYQNLSTRNITVGELVPYNFVIRNEGITVFTAINIKVFSDFSYVMDVPDDQVFSVFPGGEIMYDTTLICRYRGEYKVGVSKVVLTDFLKLFSYSYSIMSPFEAIVKPRIINLDLRQDIPDLDVFIHNNVKGEINEPDLVVRDYIPGDSLKKIHWKSTAKTAKIKVRNEIGILKEKILLITDFERVSLDIHEYLPLENKVLEQTIGLLYHFVCEKIPIKLVYHTHELFDSLISDIGRFNTIYEELSKIHFRRENSFLSLYEKVSHYGLITGVQLVLMVVHYMDDELYARLAELVRTSKVTVIYVITNEDITKYCRQSTERFRILKVGLEC